MTHVQPASLPKRERGINPAQHLAYLKADVQFDDDNNAVIVIKCDAPTCEGKVIYSAGNYLAMPVTEINSASTHHVNRGVELS